MEPRTRDELGGRATGEPSGAIPSSARSRAYAALFRPVDIAWLAAFRVLFGLVMCVSMLRFIGYGWLDTLFVEPTFHFKYWGFGWVEPLPPAAMHALFWALAGLGLAVAAGLCFRVSTPLFVLGFTYLSLIDVTTYLNHYYLAILLGMLLAISPAHRAFSVDARIWPHLAAARVPAAWLYLFRFQIAVVYTFAGLAKLNADWLLHAQPLRIWLASKTGMPVLGPLFLHDWAAPLMSWAGFLFDTSIAWLLLVRRIRPFAYVAVIVFHALTRALFPIGMFPVIMVLSALVFFSPGWPRGWIARARDLLARRASRAAPAAPASAGEEAAGAVAQEPRSPATRRLRAVGLTLGAIYCAVQLALPLRFLAYGGDVRWHEQGMRFSWRVMVREKNGSITFLVRNKQTGRLWQVSPSAYLTRLQEREMSGQPDLILQLAHHIRDDFERRGHGPVEVRVEAVVSLNGRRGAPMIEPSVDLASISDGIGRAWWILPRPPTQPLRIRPI